MLRSRFEDLLSKVPTLENITSKVDEQTKERYASQLVIDKQFQDEAIQAIHSEGHTNTLIIVNTGHSIPVGLALLKQFGLSIQWKENFNLLDEQAIERLKSQCLAFADEIKLSKSKISNSLVILLDCHAKQGEQPSLPTHIELAHAGINKVILLDEVKLGSIPIEKSRLKNYLEDLKHNRFAIKRLGIDRRQSERQTSSFSAFSRKADLFKEPRITYTEQPVEKLGESFYAQSKQGNKRYICDKGDFYKVVSGFKKTMDPLEIEEFKKSIESFEAQQTVETVRKKP